MEIITKIYDKLTYQDFREILSCYLENINPKCIKIMCEDFENEIIKYFNFKSSEKGDYKFLIHDNLNLTL
jgi:hypothetical protein